MKSKKETFSSLMGSFGYRYDLRSVFEDFLTMAMCTVTQIPGEGKSHYEDIYLETVAKYAKDDLRHLFPKLFACLVLEMEERVADDLGNDVLGEYYELNFCKKNSGQFFTPMPVCNFMAQSVCGEKSDETKRVLDPTCGSGRMLIAGAKFLGPGNEFHGIDLDHTCVKMTALNLFLNGIFHSEVMWADALLRDDFKISYVISLFPLGIFRIENKEQSKLWHMYKNCFPDKEPAKTRATVTLPSKSGEADVTQAATQMSLF